MNWLSMFIACLVVFLLLLCSEIGWRKGWLRGEFGRKFVHITVGTFVAFWPYFMDWQDIRVLSLAFFFGVIIAFRLGLFRAVSTYQRPTYGEVLFALSVGFLTIITESKGIYTAAILQMSLADGFAAVLGRRYGGPSAYRVFHHHKSVVGTATFFIISLTVLTVFAMTSGLSPVWWHVVGIALVATVLENVVDFGFDNLVVPVVAGVMLRFL